MEKHIKYKSSGKFHYLLESFRQNQNLTNNFDGRTQNVDRAQLRNRPSTLTAAIFNCRYLENGFENFYEILRSRDFIQLQILWGSDIGKCLLMYVSE